MPVAVPTDASGSVRRYQWQWPLIPVAVAANTSVSRRQWQWLAPNSCSYSANCNVTSPCELHQTLTQSSIPDTAGLHWITDEEDGGREVC